MNSSSPSIAVVGAGAVGCFHGALLARAGHRVTLIGRPSHVEAVTRDGLRLDVQALRPLGPWMPNTSVRLSVLNALNRDIEPARDYRMPGRQLYAGLRWEVR